MAVRHVIDRDSFTGLWYVRDTTRGQVVAIGFKTADDALDAARKLDEAGA